MGAGPMAAFAHLPGLGEEDALTRWAVGLWPAQVHMPLSTQGKGGCSSEGILESPESSRLIERSSERGYFTFETTLPLNPPA